MARLNDKRQLWAFVVVAFLVFISILYYQANVLYLYIIAYLWFGFAYGMLQQYGRFCFASAWRDLIMFKVTRMFVGIMIAFTILSIVSAILYATNMHAYHFTPMGLHEIIGGTLFGFGMVIAGGCATGSLYKTGEGNMAALIVVLSISFSQAIFLVTVFDYIFYNLIIYQPVVKFHEYFAQFGVMKYFISALILGVLIPLALLVFVYFKTGRPAHLEGGKSSLRSELAGFWSMITASKRTAIAGIAIGIISGLQIFTQRYIADMFGFSNFGEALTRMGFTNEPAYPPWAPNGRVFDPKFWYITTQEAQFAAWIMEGVGINMRDNVFFGQWVGVPAPWNNPPLLLSFGLILGATTMALLTKEFSWKIPTKGVALAAIIGGTFMGVGARIALGCNIGGFYTRASFGNPGGWIFFLGMGLGALLAAKVITWWTMRKFKV